MSQAPASVRTDSSVLGIPSFQWKFLSTAEKDAVDQSLDVIRTQRFKDISLTILDDAGKQYTGPIHVTQDSTSFIAANGAPLRFWADYVALTPSRTYDVWAPWNLVEVVRGAFRFNIPDISYREAIDHGMTDFHLYIGPNVPQTVAPDIVTFPEWAKSLDYDSLRSAMQEYVNQTVTHFKGRISYYHIWREANAWEAAPWPIDRILDIIKMEAVTIRSIDPSARIIIDLMNIFPGRRNGWTTEDFVNRMLAAGIPFDIIGLETHYGSGRKALAGGLDTLYNRLIALSRFGMPLYIWEDGLTSHVDLNTFPEEWAGWHGVPSEEKQAEFMVAGTLVYLGNPSVLGIHWFRLQDHPGELDLVQAHDGVLHYPNATRKLSFYALQNLWGNLTAHATIQSASGVAAFTGLAGEYTVKAEGYLPVKIRVAEGVSAQSFSITLVSLNPRTVSTSTSSLPQTPATQLEQAGGSNQWILAGAIVVVALTLFFAFRKLRRPKRA